MMKTFNIITTSDNLEKKKLIGIIQLKNFDLKKKKKKKKKNF